MEIEENNTTNATKDGVDRSERTNDENTKKNSSKEVTLVSQRSSRGSAINYAILRYAQLEKKKKSLEQEQRNQNQNENEVRKTEGEAKELENEEKHQPSVTKYTQIKPYERYIDRRWLLCEPDDCSVYQIELMKVTAMFAASSGSTFLNALRRKEERNKDYSFLLPRSIYSNYFNSLVDSYRCVLLSPKPSQNLAFKVIIEEKQSKTQPPKIRKSDKDNENAEIEKKQDILLIERDEVKGTIGEEENTREDQKTTDQKKEEENNTNESEKIALHDAIMLKLAYDQFPEDIFEGLVHIHEHNRLLQEAKQKKINEAESERTMYNQVDWQDFEVVATLDFQADSNESESESEDEEGEEEEEEDVMEIEKNEETVKEIPLPIASIPQSKSQTLENDDDSEEGVYREQDDSEDEEIVRVRDDYQLSTAVGKADQYSKQVLDSRTGQIIPLEDLEEYQRIQFIDPRYEIESKRAADSRKETGLAGGAEVVANLETIVRKRNALIALEEEEKLQKQEERARKRRMLERQKQEKLANKNEVDSNMKEEGNFRVRKESSKNDENDDAKTEEAISKDQQSKLKNVEEGIYISAPKIIKTDNTPVIIHPPITVLDASSTVGTNRIPGIVPSQPLQYSNTALMGDQNMQITRLSETPPSNFPQPPAPPPPQQSLLESSVIAEGKLSEDEFLSTYSNEQLYPRSQYKFIISFPSSGSPSSSLDPDIEITHIDPSWTVKDLKSEIARRYEKLPVQKIQIRTKAGTFLKDANTLSFYNLEPGTNLDVIPKTRGGRK